MTATPSAARVSIDRPVLGLALMIGFCVLAPLSDGTAKYLAQIGFSVLQLVFIRFLFQAVVLAPMVVASGRSWRMSRLGWQLTILRTLLQIAGIWLMVTGLTYLPLADAIAIAFVMPFILLLLGHFVLGETVGLRRLTACGVGFVGTLMVMQPSFAAVGWPVLYPLSVAFVFAGFMLVTRRIAHEADPLAMQATSGAMAVGLLGLAYVVLSKDAAMVLLTPGENWPILVLMGALGTLSHLLMTWSLRYAPASTLAPIQYLEIPVAAVIGLALFGDLPNPLALAGIAVTIGTGLYILWRERVDA
ncbi:DMT family transporter [Jannaschia pohangensis]|uniref:EamA domain-containing membrane protein RarD n=1 Tax=Jannaschia pohangensis TaxID=390807 RepID=A0A1I3GHJ9_9RHOB|nr:DMT family transporter [Jannaschia pohangensis]SFI22946.1 EamA domain-containing membrane protein RarD [Jannaschia pohangensis]